MQPLPSDAIFALSQILVQTTQEQQDVLQHMFDNEGLTSTRIDVEELLGEAVRPSGLSLRAVKVS
jgi:hypothetical protein